MCIFFFFNDTATTEIYTLSLHDALPICWRNWLAWLGRSASSSTSTRVFTRRARLVSLSIQPRRLRSISPANWPSAVAGRWRSEEHTSELQSQSNLVCRLLLEKKKNNDVGVGRHPALRRLLDVRGYVHRRGANREVPDAIPRKWPKHWVAAAWRSSPGRRCGPC